MRTVGVVAPVLAVVLLAGCQGSTASTGAEASTEPTQGATANTLTACMQTVNDLYASEGASVDWYSEAIQACQDGEEEPPAVVKATPEPVYSAPAAETPTPAAQATEVDVWDRYGSLPDTASLLGDDYFETLGSLVCADVGAGKINSGFTHGVIAGGSLPDYVRPQVLGVYTAARAVELVCPELSGDLVRLLDEYDATYGPYEY